MNFRPDPFFGFHKDALVGIDDTSVPSASDPSAVLYSFRLEGVDANWSAWTPRTYTEYPGLPNGRYTFQVMARDSSGNTSSVESRVFTVINSLTYMATPLNLESYSDE